MAGEKLVNFIKIKAANGKRTICANNPTVNDLGIINNCLKSCLVKFNPRLMVINANTKSINKSMLEKRISSMAMV